MYYSEELKKKFHDAVNEDVIREALDKITEFMNEHVDQLYDLNRHHSGLSELEPCFDLLRKDDIIHEIALIAWNIYSRNMKEPILWECYKTLICVGYCSSVDPEVMKRVYPGGYVDWLNTLTMHAPSEYSVVDVMFGYDATQMIVHISLISPQREESNKRGFSILATDLIR